MKVPLLDLKNQYEQIREEILSAVKDVFESQRFILGSKVEKLERQVAGYCQAGYAVGVSSGTDALLISLRSAGVGFGDLVITTPYTFFATAGAIVRVGARPLFVDIDKDTYNMNPAKLEEAIAAVNEEEKAKIKAVIPIHLFGQCADMEPILAISKSYGLTVIEDAAQAIGAEYVFSNGAIMRAGAMGKFGCFSFFPTKNLGAFGDGGMVVTQDEETRERLRIMRVHGSKPKYHHLYVGGNFRLDALQAAILMVKMKYLDGWTRKRQQNAALYRKFFQEAPVFEGITLPKEKEGRHIYNQFVIKLDRGRDELKKFLNGEGIGCEIYYPYPLHMQPCLKYLGYEAEAFPVSLEASQKTLALPIYPELKEEHISYVVDMIKKFREGARAGFFKEN